MNFQINMQEYTYELPNHRIASHPLAERDQSKLLVYSKGTIQHRSFLDLPDLLPLDSIVFFNDTKVIPARILFEKETGAAIEIFLLHPVAPSHQMQLAMQATGSMTWKCTIGNLKRWPEHSSLQKVLKSVNLSATLVDRGESLVKFSWQPPELSFAEVVDQAGQTPLPPYIKRKVDPDDRERYQTIYSHYQGAVAAPTAGLHFTDSILKKMRERNIVTDFLTLHVSAGTFQPVKTENAADHPMHAEQIVVSKQNVENAMSHHPIVAVGTTSLRTLESVYWYGVKLLKDKEAEFAIDKMDPYRQGDRPSAKSDALRAVWDKMENDKLESITGSTSIYMMPGYSLKVCNSLITNFHQPGSTLILLVAAFVGTDWKRIYQEALARDYRFLSYGDSSLLIP